MQLHATLWQVTVEQTLNAIWATLAAAAMIAAWHHWPRPEPATNPVAGSAGNRLLRLVGVGLICASLFPFISLSDDALQLEHVASQVSQHGKPGHPVNQRHPKPDLLRLYETLENPLLCRSCCLVLTFFFLGWMIIEAVCLVDRRSPRRAGRSPPPCSLLAAS